MVTVTRHLYSGYVVIAYNGESLMVSKVDLRDINLEELARSADKVGLSVALEQHMRRRDYLEKMKLARDNNSSRSSEEAYAQVEAMRRERGLDNGDSVRLKRAVCVDFDGVCHSYTSGWKGVDVIPDKPVPGAFEALEGYLRNDLRVVIYSARSSDPSGRGAMKAWFKDNGASDELMEGLEFPDNKPPALVYIDDRGFRFEGVWPTADEVFNMKPWKCS